MRTSRSRPQARAAGPTRPSVARDLRRDRARCPRSAPAPTACPTAARPRRVDVALRGVEPRRAARATRARVDVEADAAGADQAAAEAAAAQRARSGSGSRRAAGRRSDAVGRKPTSPASAPRSPVWLASRSSSSAIAAQRVRARGDAAPGERLDDLAVGGRVADRGVAGERLDVVDGPLVGPADQRALDAAVLVAERDLEVEDVLAVALEAEVAGLDDAGVHRADRDLVDLLALDAVEVGSRRRRAARRPGGPTRRARAAASGVKRTGLSQGWPSGTTPHCSAISRSKRCTCGHSGVSDGIGVAVDGGARRPRATPSSSAASTATSSTRAVRAGAPNSAATRRPRAGASMTARRNVVERRAAGSRRAARPRRCAAVSDARSLMAAPPRSAAASRSSALERRRDVDAEQQHQAEERDDRRRR